MTVVDALRAALGDAVSTDDSALESARSDKSGFVSRGRPLAVVAARSIDDVQETLRIASEHGTPVVTRGAGTGLAGGGTAGEGEIVLSMLGLNRILEVSTADELAVVQPGVINGDLNAHLGQFGYWFAPDPASRAISSVGGNIATNAGGLLCAKYGVTREAVLGLVVVLADGTLLRLGRRSVKGVTGLDLTSLFIGSEGTLGVIVEATVRIRPRPRGNPATISAWFDDIDAALQASADITATGIVPSIMELLDSQSVSIIAAHWAAGAAEAAEHGTEVSDALFTGAVHLLVQVDGGSTAADASELVKVIEANRGRATVTIDPDAAERMLAVRRSFHPALERLGTVLIEDVCVPRSALPDMFRQIARLEERFGLRIPTVAHAGDGNLHPNFIVDSADGIDTVPEKVWEAAGELFRAALALGGTLTGEHGVGLLKKRWLGEELGDEQLRVQREIKTVFDAQGILNPGKVF
ncbi:MAG: FAD-binding protein [Cryobacterium sp.]|nr:FAD-binding protein [Cryobacterium sp.]